MKFKLSLLVFAFFVLASCGINRTRNSVKVGKWVSKDTIDGISYKYIEYYKNGQETKTWRIYKNNTISKSEKYKGNTSTIKFYNEAKQVIATGKTQLDETEKLVHWYYHGDWRFYDNNGKLLQTKSYYYGKIMATK
ncbi:MAG: antitoxin component YwqK of YwqJK toxin-antitoxin module [Flavobacterium sp.]|jgi:antitoxin component YwqK of YwqJK toxin-antitoxin module